MADKKNEVITFRTETWVKDELQRIAEENKWTIAQTVNQLCMNFIVNPEPNQITIHVNDLLQRTEEIKEEGKNKGAQISIDLIWEEDTQEYKKKMNIDILESGGLGLISGYDSIDEMTQDEILDIP